MDSLYMFANCGSQVVAHRVRGQYYAVMFNLNIYGGRGQIIGYLILCLKS